MEQWNDGKNDRAGISASSFIIPLFHHSIIPNLKMDPGLRRDDGWIPACRVFRPVSYATCRFTKPFFCGI